MNEWKYNPKVQRLLTNEFFFMFIRKIIQKYGIIFTLKNIFKIRNIYKNLIAISFYYSMLDEINVWLRNRSKTAASKINFNTLVSLSKNFEEGRAYPYKTIMYNIIN